MLVYCEITYISLLSENDRIFAKIAKNIVFGCTISFIDFSKKLIKTTPVFFDEKSKTGLGFDFGQPQQKWQRRPTLQSMANPAVDNCRRGYDIKDPDVVTNCNVR